MMQLPLRVIARHCTADSDGGLPLRFGRRGMILMKPSTLYGVKRRKTGSKRGVRYRNEAWSKPQNVIKDWSHPDPNKI